MEWITSSKLYIGSSRKEKILEAFNSPLNQPLVKQLSQYVDSEYLEPQIKEKQQEDLVEELSEIDIPESSEDYEEKSKNNSSSSHSSSGFTSKPSSSSPSIDLDSDDSSSEKTDSDTKDTSDSSNNDEVKTSIKAATYVTIDDVAKVVDELPRVLNIREDTTGVSYATLKGGQSSELWIYYNDDIDVSKILDKINEVIINAGFYFLEFDRVNRSSNAVVYIVNWVSSYFHPSQLKDTNE